MSTSRQSRKEVHLALSKSQINLGEKNHLASANHTGAQKGAKAAATSAIPSVNKADTVVLG